MAKNKCMQRDDDKIIVIFDDCHVCGAKFSSVTHEIARKDKDTKFTCGHCNCSTLTIKEIVEEKLDIKSGKVKRK